MQIKTAFVLFSGFNPRAVITLAKLFREVGAEYFIVSMDQTDPIWNSSACEKVVFSRIDSQLDLRLFEKVAASLIHFEQVVICPTTEFLNHFLLENRANIPDVFDVQLPPKEVYDCLTNKASFLQWVPKCASFTSPQEFPECPTERQLPSVAKPFVNINKHNETLYPQLLQNKSDLSEFMELCDPSEYFYQEYVIGCSYYFCFYISPSGRSESFVQKNLCQQPRGKSIVWARKSRRQFVRERQILLAAMQEIGFFGWIMLEFIERGNELVSIEANPRFWGPLQLAIDVCPRMAEMFIKDSIGKNVVVAASGMEEFFWLNGFDAKESNYRWYTDMPENLPAFISSKLSIDVERRCE